MFCAIWIKPINLAATCKLLQSIISKRSLHQITPLDVTNPTAKEVVSGVLCLLDVKQRKKRETTVLKSAPISQVKMLSSLNNHRPFRKPGVFERKTWRSEALTARQNHQRKRYQKSAHDDA